MITMEVLHMIDKIKEHKKILLAGLGILIVVVVIVVLVCNRPKKDKVSEKEKLTTELEKIGRNYYENYYYVSAANSSDLNDKKNYLKNFTSVGLKINLENLQRYNNTLKDKNETVFKNTKANKDCDLEKSMVTIYPTEPYGEKDYKISVFLDCGFEEKEEK